MKGATKKQMLKSEMKEHGTAKRFAEVKKAKTPKQLAKVIVKQHGDGKAQCSKCGKDKGKCKC
jgi:hypothetical protein